MNSGETHFCEGCRSAVVPVRPHWGWRVASVGAFAFFIVMTVLIGAGGLLIVGGGVVVFALGVSVIGPLEAEASRPTTCPTCRREVLPLHGVARTHLAISPRRS